MEELDFMMEANKLLLSMNLLSKSNIEEEDKENKDTGTGPSTKKINGLTGANGAEIDDIDKGTEITVGEEQRSVESNKEIVANGDDLQSVTVAANDKAISNDEDRRGIEDVEVEVAMLCNEGERNESRETDSLNEPPPKKRKKYVKDIWSRPKPRRKSSQTQKQQRSRVNRIPSSDTNTTCKTTEENHSREGPLPGDTIKINSEGAIELLKDGSKESEEAVIVVDDRTPLHEPESNNVGGAVAEIPVESIEVRHDSQGDDFVFKIPLRPAPKKVTGKGSQSKHRKTSRYQLRKRIVPAPPLSQPQQLVTKKKNEPEQIAENGQHSVESSIFTKQPVVLLRVTGTISDWDAYLENLESAVWVCSVDCFPHAPFATTWSSLAKRGLTVEIPHPQSCREGKRRVFSIATIMAFAGYKALLRFERVGHGPYIYAWMSFCSSVPKPFTYALRKGYLIHPVLGEDLGRPIKEINARHNDCQLQYEFCDKYYGPNRTEKNRTTISWDHEQEVREEIIRHQSPFRLSQVVEVIDKENYLRNRLGRVVSITGDRLYVQYLDVEEDSFEGADFFHASMQSEFIHPLGWTYTIGHVLRIIDQEKLLPIFGPSRNFPKLRHSHFPGYPKAIKIKVGMVFELRHPFQTFKIVSGYVARRLSHGYFIACVETNCASDYAQFLFHITSDYILPCGFCKTHNVELEVPHGEDPNDFSWKSYCEKTKKVPLDLKSLLKKPRHKFGIGGKLEAASDIITQPAYFGPATIRNIAGHLLLLHFDGFSEKQIRGSMWMWISAVSPDIYPAGWAEMVGHTYEGIPTAPNIQDLYYIAQTDT